MAITGKDIREKDFSTQAFNGYNIEEVDDFLDELADQLDALVRENMALKNEAKKAAPAPAAAPVAAAAQEDVSSAYDEPSYFKNLEQAMRETLISSQRIADETIADARKKAQEILDSAHTEADSLTARADEEVADAKKKVETLQKKYNTYRTDAIKLLDQQTSVIEEMREALK